MRKNHVVRMAPGMLSLFDAFSHFEMLGMEE